MAVVGLSLPGWEYISSVKPDGRFVTGVQWSRPMTSQDSDARLRLFRPP